MWICADCNQLVPDPVNRKCPKGHGLFDRRIFGSTKEVTAGTSFRNTLIVCIVIAALAAVSRAWLTVENTTAIVVMVMVAFAVAGMTGFARGNHWQKQGGAVLRLVPRANGMALGCFAAVVLLIALAFAVSALRGS